MQNNSALKYPRPTPGLVAGFVVLLAMSLEMLVNSNIKITDPFHKGEYFASFVSIFRGQESPGLITIHGALDFIPAWLSHNIYGANHYFSGTLVIYALANVLAAIMFYVLVAIFTERFSSHYQAIVLIVAAMVSTMMVNYRDLLLLASLLLYFSGQMEQRPLTKLVTEIGLGLTVASNLFWSFDRGIAGVVSIGFACLIMAYRNRSGFIAALSFFVCLFIFNFSTETFSLHNYVTNIKFLMATSPQWSYGSQTQPVIRSVALLLLCLLGLFSLSRSIGSKSTPSNALLANGILLGVLTIIFLKIGTNRADMTHIHWAMWPVFLAFLYGQHVKENLNCVVEDRVNGSNKLPSLIRHFGFANLSFLLISIALIAPTSLLGTYYFLSSIIRPSANEELVSEGVKWVSNEIKHTKSKCALDLSNHGVINGLADLPACTRFAYPVYANENFQNEIIDNLKSKMPEVVVYSSTSWSFAIDNKNMHTRLPILRDYLDSKYSKEVCKFEYCLRYFKTNQPQRNSSK